MSLLLEKRNSEIFLRPRFSIGLNKNSEEILKHFENAFADENCKVRGNISEHHIFIDVDERKEHFWSPQLQLEVIEQTKNTAVLKGLFGPKPQVWTFFMFIHFLLGIGFLCFCVMFFTRLSLKESIFLPVSMLTAIPFVWILLYFLGRIGKDTGKKQMQELHNFMIKVIDN